ncbi:inorganic diphosphatase [Neolewinella aurantiaca]|uniref:Inorganic pyrophosphatase n=1 Tax=Neolewinella aurantiaca TaxID=2602767 RepID=A0A5C7FI48_9BACT|nr:inorganic diphosphatase [Neolewinella aurantiaca]TXF89426.1 inorganic diphosphatase [Neolewinella aurantiaca]
MSLQYDPTNPWHRIPVGENAPTIVNGIIEIPRGERAKYELDKTTGLLKMDRVIYSSMHYPANYGFIPQTYCDDDDPLDIMVLTQATIVPMCLVSCKVIGVMRMLDGGELDDKIIAVAENDMSVNHYNDISELPPHFKLELQTFFEDYKKLEKKAVVIEEFLGAETAKEIVVKAAKDYQTLMGIAQF